MWLLKTLDRRKHERILVDLEGAFYTDNTQSIDREFGGTIEDISEGGFKLITDSNKYDNVLKQLKNGDTIHYNAIDDYTMFGNDKTVLLMGKAKVVRKMVQGNIITYGCKYNEIKEEIKDYIQDKKTNLYLKSIKSLG